VSEEKAMAAEQAFRRGDFEAAERLCDEILAQAPRNVPATLLKGMTAVKRQRLGEAISLLQRALELSPNDYVGVTWLLGAYYEFARYPEAIALGQKARALWPDDVGVLVGLSHAYMMGEQDVEASTACLEAAVKLQPKNPVLRCKLGAAFELQAKDHEAHCEYLAAIEAAPKAEEPYSRLARLFMGHGNYVEALGVAERGLLALPQSAQMQLVHAQSLRHVREFEKADEALKKAIALDPRISLAAAKWLDEDGRFEQAAALFEKAIELGSNPGSAYYGIVKSRKMTEEDRSMLDKIEALLDGRLSLQDRAAVHYALGKAANDMGEYGKAIGHFDEGNAVNYRLHLSGKPYDAKQIGKWRDETISMASPTFMEQHRRLGCDSELPIFIVGMIRSGTTLTEQIISSHPEVGGGGEQRFWLAEAPGIVDVEKQTLNEGKFVEARDRYLAVLRGLEPNAKRITDKMPMNYYVLWLIHLAYPKAKIIHVKRSPIDTALSIYMTDLAKPPDFAHSKKNIVAGYRDYEMLMQHFSSIIPASSLMTLQYEDLVSDTETWTRKLLEFCGLPWDDRCLQFYANQRQVTTPSRWQVRQPIYRSSMEKWRHYEPWLGEFAELLPVAPK
jgi:tetratricopeptide (TPR) repeat protein